MDSELSMQRISNSWSVKNLLLVSISIMCIFSGNCGLVSLQSSVYLEKGLGTATLAITNVVSTFTGLFLSALLIMRFGPKRVILASMLGYAAYVAVNFHATWFTLIPGAAVLGFSKSNLSASMWTYVGSLAEQYFLTTRLAQDIVNARFYAVLLMFSLSAAIWSSLISSKLLDQKSNITVNFTSAACGAQFCDSNIHEDNKNFSGIPKNFYLLCSVLFGISILAIFIMCFADYQKPRGSENRSVIKRLVETAKKLGDPYMLLVFPITLYGGLQVSFITADITKAFITCNYGVARVGNVLLFYGMVSTVFSIANGYVVKLLGRKKLFVMATLTDVAVYFSLLFHNYTGAKGLVLLFVLISCLGTTIGVWQGQVRAFYGTLFPDCQEVVFSLIAVYESLGTAIGFVYSVDLCTQPKIYILIGLLLLGMICYMIVEFLSIKGQRRSINIFTVQTTSN